VGVKRLCATASKSARRDPENENAPEAGAFSVVGVVRKGGLEPPRCYPLAPQASASTNSAICAGRLETLRSRLVAPLGGACQEDQGTEQPLSQPPPLLR
jgi:hypothetical protein